MLMKLCGTLISSLPRAPDCREKKGGYGFSCCSYKLANKTSGGLIFDWGTSLS